MEEGLKPCREKDRGGGWAFLLLVLTDDQDKDRLHKKSRRPKK
jgi:hypothetical protein